MKMRRTWALVAAIVMSMSLALGGTLAYLSDTDSAVNVMTLGNVSIEQHEKERVDMTAQSKENPVELQDFKQNKPLYPAVLNMDGKLPNDTQAWAPGYGSGALADHAVNWGDFVTADVAEGSSAWNGIWSTDLKNVVDKFVFVENTGKSDAYYRTIILMEHDETETMNAAGQTLVHYNYNGNALFSWVGTDDEEILVEVDGEKYFVIVATYQKPLKPGTVSRPSLLQVGLDGDATNEIVEQFGDTYDILVLSQAVQAQGFDKPETALDAAFGEVNETNIKEWFGGMLPVTYVDSADTLADAINNGDTNIIYTADEPLVIDEPLTLNNTKEPVTIDLGGQTLQLKGEEGRMVLGKGADVTINNAALSGDDDNFVEIGGGATLTLGEGATLDAGEGALQTKSGMVRVYGDSNGEGKLVLSGVTISGNTGSGSLINVADGAEIVIEDGTVITGNTLTGNQNYLIQVTGKLTMNGGVIENNTFDRDLIGLEYGGEFIMNGGSIINNKDTANTGNIVAIFSGAHFEMNGGLLSNPDAAYEIIPRGNGTYKVNDGATVNGSIYVSPW